MKQLQNNYTSPEQSKRLLELGVPADSADCFISPIGYMGIWQDEYEDKIYRVDYIPCWSVGRLIEIYVIARGVDTAYLPIERDEDTVKYLIRLYEEKVKDLDFSKLEG